MYKNIEKQVKLTLKDQVDYLKGQVVSKTLVQNDLVSMTIFSFDKGEEISTHASGGDAMVTVLEGKGRFTVADEVFYLEEGETLIMPKGIPHAVYGEEKFKMQLVVSFQNTGCLKASCIRSGITFFTASPSNPPVTTATVFIYNCSKSYHIRILLISYALYTLFCIYAIMIIIYYQIRKAGILYG